MTPENEWEEIRSRRKPLLGVAGMSMLRAALLFGSAAAALALILTPLADRYAQSHFGGMDGLDYSSTGSIGSPANSYTIRRSVLQQPGAVCIIRADGQRSSGC
jgi:hypothetical protein